MNERIKELVAKTYHYDTYEMVQGEQVKVYGFTYAGITELAELIVKECMRMCDVADMSLLEHNCVKEASGTQSAKDFIKEHFGVEE